MLIFAVMTSWVQVTPEHPVRVTSRRGRREGLGSAVPLTHKRHRGSFYGFRSKAKMPMVVTGHLESVSSRRSRKGEHSQMVNAFDFCETVETAVTYE